MTQITPNDDYDIFVSYDELTGDEYAERVYNSLRRRGYKVFVAHIERPDRSGKFRDFIDRIIVNCSTFILINTLDVPNRDEIIREFKQAFPKNDSTEDNFWVFRHDQTNVPLTTDKFFKETGFDLSKENQSPFKTPANLAHAVLSKCDKKKQQKIQSTKKSKTVGQFDEEQRKDYSEFEQEKLFTKEFKKRGYHVDFQREIGNNISADLILQKNNHWIICEFKKNASNISNTIFSHLLKYKQDLESIENDLIIELWLIGSGLFNDTVKKEAKKLKIKIIDDSNINEILEHEHVFLSVPTSIVSNGELVNIRLRVDEIKEQPLKLKIKNKKGDVIHHHTFTPKSTEWIDYEFVAKGPDWEHAGDLFSIIAEYGEQSVLSSIWRSNFGATIEFDQKVYSWTDKVYITVVAPDFRNKDTILVDVATNEDKLPNYKLNRTGSNTGIFTGEICLSGFPYYVENHPQFDNPHLGITKGDGPVNGLIKCINEDAFQVSFQFSQNETVVGSALIRWNIGEIQWLESSYPASGTGIVRVIDPDMNLNPNAIDTIEIKIWSDSDVIKKSVTLHETNEATGIFEGEINFDSEISDENTLLVSEGDTIIAEYFDYTLPDPYSANDHLKISATSMIGIIVPALERINVDTFELIDDNYRQISNTSINSRVTISINLYNKNYLSQDYVLFVQIRDGNNIPVFLESRTGIVFSDGFDSISIKWIPKLIGKFSVTIFVWESLDNPIALSPPFTKEIFVEDKKLKITEILPTILTTQHIVHIPEGSSIPGCGKTGKCFIPNILEIQVNDEVLWYNDDSASHTITSGTPDLGPDGTFDSGLFMPEASFSFRFTTKGKYPYFDMVHPWQTGIIIVK